MRANGAIVGLLVVGLLGVLCAVTFRHRPQAPTIPTGRTLAQAGPAPFSTDGAQPRPNLNPATQPVRSLETAAPAPPSRNVRESLHKPSASRNSATPGAKPPLQDPLAREALSLVGTDPEAEAYWFRAINNPSLPANERKDLIEDLNEDGLSDPKHPTSEDLPLILSRIELLELLGPQAIDEVNQAAFQEAYKDLVNLVDVATGSGTPVR